jgi:hypothetical protein
MTSGERQLEHPTTSHFAAIAQVVQTGPDRYVAIFRPTQIPRPHPPWQMQVSTTSPVTILATSIVRPDLPKAPCFAPNNPRSVPV